MLDVIFEKDIKENSYKLIIFDQPEDNLDVSTLKNKLISRIRDMKLKQQIIVVSHSAPLVVNGDANNIIISQFNNEKIYLNTEMVGCVMKIQERLSLIFLMVVNNI